MAERMWFFKEKNHGNTCFSQGLFVMIQEKKTADKVLRNGGNMDKKIQEDYIKILREELVPAMGCTEPIALAYASAKAREVLGAEPKQIRNRSVFSVPEI